MDKLFTSAEFWDPVVRSASVAVLASAVVIFLGTWAGGLMAQKNFKGKPILETIMMLPLVLPPSVVGFGLLVIFGKQSFIGEAIQTLFHHSIIFTFWAAVLASTVVAYPLMYQTVKVGFQGIPKSIQEAARIDGAGFLKLFLLIQLPLARASVFTGGLLAFARALGEFGATLMIAGNIPFQTQTMPTAIYLAVETNRTSAAWAWVAITIILSFVLLFFSNQSRSSAGNESI